MHHEGAGWVIIDVCNHWWISTLLKGEILRQWRQLFWIIIVWFFWTVRREPLTKNITKITLISSLTSLTTGFTENWRNHIWIPKFLFLFAESVMEGSVTPSLLCTTTHKHAIYTESGSSSLKRSCEMVVSLTDTQEKRSADRADVHSAHVINTDQLSGCEVWKEKKQIKQRRTSSSSSSAHPTLTLPPGSGCDLVMNQHFLAGVNMVPLTVAQKVDPQDQTDLQVLWNSLTDLLHSPCLQQGAVFTSDQSPLMPLILVAGHWSQVYWTTRDNHKFLDERMKSDVVVVDSVFFYLNWSMTAHFSILLFWLMNSTQHRSVQCYTSSKWNIIIVVVRTGKRFKVFLV